MDRTLRRTLQFIVGLFVFALLWRLLFDEVTGKNARQSERYRHNLECNEITSRLEHFYKTNQFFPTNATEVLQLTGGGWSILRPAEELATNYILRSSQASQAIAAGRTNVPVVFERLRPVGRERGGLIGFVNPRKVRWYDEPEYQQFLEGR